MISHHIDNLHHVREKFDPKVVDRALKSTINKATRKSRTRISKKVRKKYGVKIYVGETLGTTTGTYITDQEEIIEKKAVKGISLNENILSVSIENIATYPKNVSIIFNACAKHEVNVDMISQNDISGEKGSIAFTCPLTDEAFLDAAIKEIKESLPEIKVTKHKDFIKVSLVGIGMISHFGVAASVFNILAEKDISFHQCSTSEISISILIDKDNLEPLIESLATKFEM